MRIGLLREHKGFRDLWLGQAISQVGDSLYYAGFMFMVKKLTHSDAMVGYIGAVEVLPYFLLSPYAGVMVDRIDRRLVLLLSDFVSAGLLLLLALATWINGSPPIWALFVAAGTLASVRSFFYPAKNAAIPRLVPVEKVTEAFAFSLGTQSLMMVGGTVFAATVLAQLYNYSDQVFFYGLVLANMVSFALSGVFVWKLPKIMPERAADEVHLWTDLTQGWSFVRKRTDLITLFIVSALFSLAVSPFFVVYVGANDAWFGGHPRTLAICESCFFLGMIAGNYLVGKWPPKRVGVSYCWALVGVGVMVGFMAFSQNFFLYSFWNLLCGICVPYAETPRVSYMQLSVPDAFRGRVNSLFSMLTTSMMPLGMVGAGAMVTAAGIGNSHLIMAGLMAFSALVGLAGREFRRAELPAAKAEPAA